MGKIKIKPKQNLQRKQRKIMKDPLGGKRTTILDSGLKEIRRKKRGERRGNEWKKFRIKVWNEMRRSITRTLLIKY